MPHINQNILIQENVNRSIVFLNVFLRIIKRRLRILRLKQDQQNIDYK